jgi:hypothetical protein
VREVSKGVLRAECEHELHDLGVLTGKVESNPLLYLPLQLLHVLPILLRKDQTPHPLPLRTHSLLLHPSDRIHPPRKCNLPRHRYLTLLGSVERQREEGRCDRYACRWSVLPYLYLWEVEVHVVLL